MNNPSNNKNRKGIFKSKEDFLEKIAVTIIWLIALGLVFLVLVKVRLLK